MTRILHVTECWAGGVSRAIETIVELLPEHEHHLLWAGDERPSLDVFSTVEQLPPGFLSRVSSVRERAGNLEPDVVHAHSSWAGVYSRVGSRLKAPVVYEPHCYKFDDPNSPSVMRWAVRAVERHLLRRTDMVAVLSPHEARLTRGMSRRVPITFVPNAPSLPARAGVEIAAVHRIAMAGRIVPQKGPDIFATVARQVRSHHPNVEFVWIGDGAAEARESLTKSGVRVTGWLSAEGVARELDGGTVYFHSASYEGFPLSVLDAAALQVPILARHIDALEGTPVRLESDENLAKALGELIDDEIARERARNAGQRMLETMNHSAQRRSLVALYENVSQKNRGESR
ncbi:glycosyltransferase [Galbitalea sp. SE-J8]|uniref:glycosyltransferase n=1 Tax=Galbitalea sp. SE-J8 TaxID=3054952 RepID=UPI00259C8C09|nr:glycosyltransferase [Galbitalea sp. SE-J8]MDM4763926.1 glycosyltransferase [Galbitalea sp. SE-J8]